MKAQTRISYVSGDNNLMAEVGIAMDVKDGQRFSIRTKTETIIQKPDKHYLVGEFLLSEYKVQCCQEQTYAMAPISKHDSK